MTFLKITFFESSYTLLPLLFFSYMLKKAKHTGIYLQYILYFLSLMCTLF